MRTYALKPKSIHETHGRAGSPAASTRPQSHQGPEAKSSDIVTYGLGCDFGRIPVHRKEDARTHSKLSVSEANDDHEQAADRRADAVLGAGQWSEPSRSEAGSNRQTSAPVSLRSSSTGETPLEPADRQFFETRFKHSFADVRVHADREGNESARALKARAYTVGNEITFAGGEYRPGTSAGRALLAHELAHVVQQRSVGLRDAAIIQREPQGTAKKAPPTAKPETLKSKGVDLADPVAGKTAQIIDAVLQRNKRLAPYIGDRLKSGFNIGEKGHFVKELSDANFDSAYRKTNQMNSSEMVPRDTMGFFDDAASTIHLRPDAKFGTALHEAVHRLASPGTYAVIRIATHVSTELVEVLKEGLTAFFTDGILSDEGLPNFNDAYRGLKKKAEGLVTALGTNGFDLIAKFNFKTGSVFEIGKVLGFSEKQYGDLKGTAISAVLKKLNSLL